MDLKIYTLPNCPYSKQLKDWLKKKKISFQECDLEENDNYRDEVLKKTGQLAAPIIVTNSKYHIGFHEDALEQFFK